MENHLPQELLMYSLLETKSHQFLFQHNKEIILIFFKKKLKEKTEEENQV